jgi:prophage DNA circulation protein
VSWRDQLKNPASFRGVTFFVESAERTGGRRGVTHEYPFRDEPFREDLGRQARGFTVEGFVIGDEYLAARDRLIGALESPSGPGQLVHPYYGARHVAVLSFRVRETAGDGGLARFSIEFEETPASPVQPTATVDATEKARTAATAARTGVGDAFLAVYAPGVRRETLADMPRRLSLAVDTAMETVQQETQAAAALASQTAALTAAAATLVNEPADILASLVNLFDSLTVDVRTVLGLYDVDPGVAPPSTVRRAGGSVTLTGVGGTAASTTLTFGSASGPWTVTINGALVGDTATGDDATDAEILYLAIHDSVDPLIVGVVESAWDGVSGDVTISAVAKGVGGNSITLAFSGTGLSGSGATLLGGADGEVTVTVDGTAVVTSTTGMTDTAAATAVAADIAADGTLGELLTAEGASTVISMEWGELGSDGNVSLVAASDTGTAVASGATFTGGADTTSNRLIEQENFGVLLALIQRLAVIRSAELLLEESFDSYDAAVELRDEVTALLDEQMETGTDDSFPALMALRAALVLAVPGAESDLPRLIPYTPTETLPSLALSWSLYGNLDGEADLLARNAVVNPMTVVGGTELEVLSDA